MNTHINTAGVFFSRHPHADGMFVVDGFLSSQNKSTLFSCIFPQRNIQWGENVSVHIKAQHTHKFIGGRLSSLFAPFHTAYCPKECIHRLSSRVPHHHMDSMSRLVSDFGFNMMWNARINSAGAHGNRYIQLWEQVRRKCIYLYILRANGIGSWKYKSA